MFPTLTSLIEERLVDDPALTQVAIHAFNEWLHDVWSFDYQGRIFATPIVNPCLLDEGIAELELLIERGAKAVQGPVGPMELNIPAIEGIGGSNLYLVDRYGTQEIYDVDFVPIPGAEAARAANEVGLTYLDHLTHNVHRGQMAKWADFYEKIFNFREIRYFDIEGSQTGLFSKAMTSPCGKIRIPDDRVIENDS